MNKQEQPLRQAMILLPFVDYEVPVVYLENGTPYIPVRALCDMLGLRAETHIRRWRNLVLWASARKLLYRTNNGKKQIVWCLHEGAVPQLYCCFNWSLVSAERREQLTRATDEWLSRAEVAHQEMLVHYRYIRSYLFEFLTVYANADAWLDQCAVHFRSRLQSDALQRLEELLSQGQLLIGEATVHARHMVQEQATNPIVDVVSLNSVGEIIGTFSTPLLPAVPHEEREQFFASLRTLSQWHQTLAMFVKEYGGSANG